MAWSIRFQGASRSFDGTVAVDRIDLEIPPSSLVVLLGSSGSGKTTALRMVNRMVEPSAGRVLVNDRDVLDSDPVELRRSIGYVIQQGGLFPHWTAAQNVALVPRLLGWPSAEVEERVRQAMALAQIPVEQFGERHPSTLSGGQSQRVAVARALAARPQVLLLDEPFGALDPVTRSKLQEELRAWLSEVEATTVMVTHDVGEAFRLADRIALMERGRLVQYGTPEELAFRPAEQFVASFLAPTALEVRLGWLKLHRLQPFLPTQPDCEPVEVGPQATVAEGLKCMALAGREAVVVRGPARTLAGPFSRVALWRLLGGGAG